MAGRQHTGNRLMSDLRDTGALFECAFNVS